MPKTFEDRVEEVLGTLHGMAWPLLEESDKRKIVGKVVQGIDNHGDSNAAWARAMGVPAQTLREQVLRFRRSEPVDGSRATEETQRKRLSHAKSVLSDPNTAAKVIESLKPSEREAVFDAAAASLDRAERSPRVAVPELDAWSEATQTMDSIRRKTVLLASLLDRTRMTDNRDADLEEWVAEQSALLRRLRTKDGRANLQLVVGGE